MDVRRIGMRLYIDGYIYKKTNKLKGKIYWKCIRHRSREPSLECDARVTTLIDTSPDDAIILYTNPVNSPHNHAPSVEEIEKAQKTVGGKNFQNASKRWKKCTCTSQNTGTQNNSRQFGLQNEPVIGDESTENTAADPEQYSQLLPELLNMPIFDQLFETIRSIHENEISGSSEASRRQCDDEIYTREECHSTTSVQENRYDVPEVLLTEENSENFNVHSEKKPRRVDHTQEIVTCNEGEMGSGKLVEQLAQKDTSASDSLPPVPAAIPMKEFLASKSSSTPVIDLSDDEVEVKKEIEVVDITDDDDVKQECLAQNFGNSDRILQLNDECLPRGFSTMISSSILQRNTIPWHHITSNNTSTGESVHSELPHDTLNPNVCGPQSCSLEAPSGLFHPEMQSNVESVNWCQPHFDQPHNDVRPNPNEPILISSLQIPFVQNNPSLNYGKDAGAEEFYTEIRFYRKPALEPRLQPQALNGSQI